MYHDQYTRMEDRIVGLREQLVDHKRKELNLNKKIENQNEHIVMVENQ